MALIWPFIGLLLGGIVLSGYILDFFPATDTSLPVPDHSLGVKVLCILAGCLVGVALGVLVSNGMWRLINRGTQG